MGNIVQVVVLGAAKVDQQFLLNLAGYNLVCMRYLRQTVHRLQMAEKRRESRF